MLYVVMVILVAVIFLAAGKILAGFGPRQAGAGKDVPKPLRGTWVVREDQGRRLWADLLREQRLEAEELVPLGNGYLLPESEQQHVKILGTSGSGKSTAIKHALSVIECRPNQRALIVDPDGGYARLFFNPERGDRILNPFDARGAHWDLASEITEPYHCELIASALVPEREGEAGEWSRYGQQLVSSTMSALHARGELSAGVLWRWISSESDMDAYRELIAGSVAEPFFAAGNERMFGSVRSTAVSALSGLAYLRGAGEWSLSRWAQSDDRGWVFFTYQAAQRDALRGIIATWCRIAIMALMSRPEGDSGTWLVLDELDALGRIASLTDALARLRKFGGRCVLGVQSIGQLKSIYGRDVTAGLLENCASSLLLKCGSSGKESGTSEYASGVIGQREVLRTTQQVSTTSGSHTSAGGIFAFLPGSSRTSVAGTNTQPTVEDAVLASQLEKLENLKGYVHSHGTGWWSRCTLPLFEREPVAEAFVPEGSTEEKN